MRRAVYAGSFDPITEGHLWMIREGKKLFDELIVAVGVNPDKRSLFTVDERKAFILDCEEDVTVSSYENMYLIDYAKSVGATHLLRGIRDISDVGFEKMMRNINSDISPEISTVFLMPPRCLADVSSSLVKGLVGPQGWESIVNKYVSHAVLEALAVKNATK